MRLAVVALASALAALPAQAAQRWIMDKAHSSITFQADHLGFSVAQGRFRDFDAEILFDPDNLAATEVTVTIDAASVDTAWPDRDREVRSRVFLNTEEHPTITFVSTTVRPTGEATADIVGDLTMIGQTRRVTFKGTLIRMAPSPFNAKQIIAGFVAEGVIERAQWGMTFGGSAFAASVPVRFDLEISPAP